MEQHTNEELLILSKPNAKIDYYSLSLPAGYSCPFAYKCLSKADKITGKITDGNYNEFRCFSASTESLFKRVRNLRHKNFDLLKTRNESEIYELLLKSLQKLPKKYKKIFRIHVSGDFFNEDYFKAWCSVANELKNILFYAYTKSLSFVIKFQNLIPSNLKIVASRGGRLDDLINSNNLRFCEVLFSKEEADEYKFNDYWSNKLNRTHGLSIDHNDMLAYDSDEPFALLIHGIQPKSSDASKALVKLGGLKSGYSKKK